jgi:NAD(P)-dependent dehydrogenase (short-subunit alcohol dehydrogenase family)
MRDLAGRTAFVTGSGSGVGRGIALGLAAEGMTVAVADVHEPSAIAVAAEIEGRGGCAFPIQVDVTSPSSLQGAARTVVERTGAVHVLCNNAGVMVAPGPSADLVPADWDYVFSVNVFGVVQGVQGFLPILSRSAPDAHIVNTASLGGLFVVDGPSLGVYLASKYACVGYTECLREELAGRGIGVSVLCPGMVESNLPHTSARNRPARFGAQPDPTQHRETEQTIDEMTRDRRTLTPEQVGPIVVRGIRENRLHIVTHPEARELVERRFAAILDDFEFAARGADALRS